MIPAPNYEDAELLRYFDHIDLFVNEQGFDGVFRIRAGVRYQTAETRPVNYRAEGLTLTAAFLNIREVLLRAVRSDDMNSPDWRWDARG